MDKLQVKISNEKSGSAEQEQDVSTRIEMLERFLNFFMRIYESPASTLRTLDNEKVKRICILPSNGRIHFSERKDRYSISTVQIDNFGLDF
ncbi:uncharacterized protein LOC123307238 [Coccinella septempunctata]|uniref:uncharacterized protein LOC123307238 n=1 Tax=Coccinella septempunctata TaxID=41139 RepID=UPI001D084F32|nr:uncharacterized protein LOC123307238 [Coccinella septempunctata]